jgi:hypothetical protein
VHCHGITGKNWLLALLLLAVSSCGWGCRSLPEPQPTTRVRESTLEQALHSLSESIDPVDAALIAKSAVEESLELSEKYEAVRPPWLHNVMVNYGFRERGLCFHWTNDLFLKLHALEARSMELHLAVARMDTRKEHNAIVVTARGEPFETGIVLDAWRKSGKLHFGPVVGDKYPWMPLPPDRFDTEIKKRLAQGSGM